MQRTQESRKERTRRGPHAFVAVVVAALLATGAVATGISDHREPGARYVVIQCEGFDALASAGARRMSCGPGSDASDRGEAGSSVRPVEDRDSGGDAAPEALRKV